MSVGFRAHRAGFGSHRAGFGSHRAGLRAHRGGFGSRRARAGAHRTRLRPSGDPIAAASRALARGAGGGDSGELLEIELQARRAWRRMSRRSDVDERFARPLTDSHFDAAAGRRVSESSEPHAAQIALQFGRSDLRDEAAHLGRRRPLIHDGRGPAFYVQGGRLTCGERERGRVASEQRLNELVELSDGNPSERPGAGETEASRGP